MSAKIFESPDPVSDEEICSYLSLGHLLNELLSGDKLKQTLFIDAASGRRWTGAQVKERALSIATALVDEGLKQGQLVAICYDHSDMSCLLVLGVIFAGGAVAYIYPKEPFPQVVDIAQKAEPSMLFGREYNLEWIDKLRDTLGLEIKGVLMDESAPDEVKSTAGHFNYYLNYRREKSNTSPSVPVACKDLKQDMVVIVSSSGTTGKPKVVPATHYNLIAELKLSTVNAKSATVIPLISSLDYVSGRLLFLRGLQLGDTFVIIDHLDVDTLAQQIEHYRFSFVNLGTAMFHKFVTSGQVDKYDISSLRIMVPSGSKVTFIEELQAFIKRHPHLKIIKHAYGSTEVGGSVSMIDMTYEQFYKEPTNCGKLKPGTKVKVIDPDSGAHLGVNQRGIAYVKSRTVFPGYLNWVEARKRATREKGTTVSPYIRDSDVFDEDGYYITGDIVYFDSDENLYVVGRYNELMVCRLGQKVLPQELEMVISEHPAVAQVCVTGMAHKIAATLHCPRAFIVLKKECLSEPIENFLTTRLDSGVIEELNFIGNHNLSSLASDPRRQVSMDIMHFVNERVSYYNQLTGGVVVLDVIPIIRKSGKMDKGYLRRLDESQIEIYGDRTGCDKEH